MVEEERWYSDVPRTQIALDALYERIEALEAAVETRNALLRETLIYVRDGECFVTACAACADEATLGKRIREAIGEKPPSA